MVTELGGRARGRVAWAAPALSGGSDLAGGSQQSGPETLLPSDLPEPEGKGTSYRIQPAGLSGVDGSARAQGQAEAAQLGVRPLPMGVAGASPAPPPLGSGVSHYARAPQLGALLRRGRRQCLQTASVVTAGGGLGVVCGTQDTPGVHHARLRPESGHPAAFPEAQHMEF